MAQHLAGGRGLMFRPMGASAICHFAGQGLGKELLLGQAQCQVLVKDPRGNDLK